MVAVPEKRLTVVMYHFIRDLRNSKFPAIKGLTIEEFTGQLDYVQTHYKVIGWSDLADALSTPGTRLPPRALLLTFDDGYRDHYENVLPELVERGLTACFYPPAKAITKQQVLDVTVSRSDLGDLMLTVVEEIGGHRSDVPDILAGGLRPDNVAAAIAIAQPYAVDVASGVEAEPGRKDHAAMAAFFEAAQPALPPAEIPAP